ncbi:MAG: LysM peptidoglycan-binding domain-containing protein [Chloroflexi bacterium]|nr:LysM peptidoglycan-binding domain-containing protein [Chloroflexota bacterium]
MTVILVESGLFAHPGVALPSGEGDERNAHFLTHSLAFKRKPTSTPRLKKRGCGVFYRVQEGDTILAIARKCRVSVWRIRSLNGLRTRGLRPGRLLRLKPAPVIRPRKRTTPQPPAPTRRLSLPTPKYESAGGLLGAPRFIPPN